MNHSLLLWPRATGFIQVAAATCACLGFVSTELSAQTPFLEFRYQFDSDRAPLVDSTRQNANLGLGQNGVEHRLGEPSLVGDGGFSIGLDAPGNNHPTGSYLTILDAPHPDTFSASIWIKPLLTGQTEAIFARDNIWWPSPCNFYCLYIDQSQSLVWKTGATETILSDVGTIEEGQLYHLVVTHLDSDGLDTGSADRSRLYVNGELIGETNDPAEIPSLDAIPDANDIFRLMWIGTLSSLGGFWGELDDFQFYSTELSAEQIAAMYANPGSLASFGDGGALLQPGDADQDLDFDQIDLVKVQIAAKYLSGQSATWGEGDWNGGRGPQGSPPPGNGRFDQLDIIAALGAGVYLTGPYAAVAAGGAQGDGQVSIGYNPSTGEVFVDAPSGVELTSVNIDSAGAIFTGAAAQNLGGSFDNDADGNIFKATFGASFGSIRFGNVARTGLSQEFLMNDLTVVGSLSGGGGLGSVDLIYVPEPSTAILVAIGAQAILIWPRRRRAE
jgi:hypothetical protein